MHNGPGTTAADLEKATKLFELGLHLNARRRPACHPLALRRTCHPPALVPPSPGPSPSPLALALTLALTLTLTTAPVH